jgi:phosphatidylserine/phosphatidylglycerophosphate/cardiolipin synthase-like enzyme
VAAVPSGGEIDWITYYFRDRRLAQALLNARRRGVRVRVTLDAKPRTGHANERVLAMLAGPDGLGRDLRTLVHKPPPGVSRRPRLHEKLYCFSHPTPAALVGSFNPSGDDPEEEPDIIDEILDQDRGHNFLVAINDPRLVNGLVRHARHIHQCPHGTLERFDPALNRPLGSGDTTVHFWPRVLPNPYSRLLQRVGHGALVRVAASHIKGPGGVRDLVGLTRRGARVEVLTESTHRRVPPAVEATLLRAGVRLRRFDHPGGLPMHNKFVLVDDGNEYWTLFGSCNWTSRSRWLNHEIGVITSNRALFEAFSRRWDAMLGQYAIDD